MGTDVATPNPTAEMTLPGFCDAWLPSVRVDEIPATVARMPTRGTRHRRDLSKPLSYGTRLTVIQPGAPRGRGGRTYCWRFYRARLPRVAVRYSWQRAAHFRFRAVFSDHRAERLFSLISDPATGRAIWAGREGLDDRGGRRSPRLIDWRLPGSPRTAPVASSSVREADYTLYRAYELARRTVERTLEDDGRREQAERRGRVERELDRLDAYYDELRREVVEPLRKLYRQIAVARVRRQLSRSDQTVAVLDRTIDERTDEAKRVEARCEEEIEWLNHEWRMRREELEAHGSLSARVALVSAAWAWMPRVTLELELDGEATCSHTLTWDVGTAWPVEGECEGCGRPSAAYTVCKGGHVRCTACASICPECGRGLCDACRSRRCAACDARVCVDCGANGNGRRLCSACAETDGVGRWDGWKMGMPGAV